MRRTLPGGWSVRRDDALAERAYAQGWWARETLGEALRRAAAADPERVLLVDGDVRVTAAGLLAEAERLARVLALHHPVGSVISFMLPNWHEAATVYLAATLAGLVANPVLPSLRDHDLRFILADARSRLVVIPGTFRGHDYAAMLARVCADLPDAPEVVVVRGTAQPGQSGWEQVIARDGAEALPAVDADAVRMVMYTSGTTGRPKGVLHTHNTIGALIRQIGRHWLVEPGDRFLVPSPVSHIGGSIYAFEMPVMLGTTAVLMDGWDPALAVELMEREGVTHMAGATPFLQGLLSAARAAGTRLDRLKVFICGGASVPPALVREAAGWFAGARVSRVYGSTEVPVTTVGALGADDADSAATTDGRPGIAAVRIAPDGEILAQGPQMMAGYAHAEDEAAAFDTEGFYRTGDQGELRADGCLVVTGRIKDLIIRNGENIAPKEIEDLLADHPAIAEIAIVGLPHPRTGERAVAVIVPRAGATPDVAALAEHLAARGVAKFKYPEAVELWDGLPRNDAGKVLKTAIRDRLKAAGAVSG
ncbi:AMP-binding protein [Novosphingobium aerophilum]|uniref:AMP-binding protein n=1 Tax=Novosphingobium aerophilum TaxID=2839843 RepID=A0A7X1F4W9_9SPHN|nr:AMP-binding protein [Novosphingobium aerophilum]MBC2650441.1 AMP-binding protein [Novosphingobium aerophilum]